MTTTTAAAAADADAAASAPPTVTSAATTAESPTVPVLPAVSNAPAKSVVIVPPPSSSAPHLRPVPILPKRLPHVVPRSPVPLAPRPPSSSATTTTTNTTTTSPAIATATVAATATATGTKQQQSVPTHSSNGMTPPEPTIDQKQQQKHLHRQDQKTVDLTNTISVTPSTDPNTPTSASNNNNNNKNNINNNNNNKNNINNNNNNSINTSPITTTTTTAITATAAATAAAATAAAATAAAVTATAAAAATAADPSPSSSTKRASSIAKPRAFSESDDLALIHFWNINFDMYSQSSKLSFSRRAAQFLNSLSTNTQQTDRTPTHEKQVHNKICYLLRRYEFVLRKYSTGRITDSSGNIITLDSPALDSEFPYFSKMHAFMSQSNPSTPSRTRKSLRTSSSSASQQQQQSKSHSQEDGERSSPSLIETDEQAETETRQPSKHQQREDNAECELQVQPAVILSSASCQPNGHSHAQHHRTEKSEPALVSHLENGHRPVHDTQTQVANVSIPTIPTLHIETPIQPMTQPQNQTSASPSTPKLSLPQQAQSHAPTHTQMSGLKRRGQNHSDSVVNWDTHDICARARACKTRRRDNETCNGNLATVSGGSESMPRTKDCHSGRRGFVEVERTEQDNANHQRSLPLSSLPHSNQQQQDQQQQQQQQQCEESLKHSELDVRREELSLRRRELKRLEEELELRKKDLELRQKQIMSTIDVTLVRELRESAKSFHDIGLTEAASKCMVKVAHLLKL